ncbi:unnamed protein product [Fusarium venenatum]|uniref:Uncharacterized protein n=1 Tax=Fusarium venenatum TaxID=56646 RepID=A0A2L2SST2_9HYPO|nr:uncharacterized protein FVRRES_12972 [Fusarium venenatum]CEI40281.1 unnamed protein product [Fusarium venenatum]
MFSVSKVDSLWNWTWDQLLEPIKHYTHAKLKHKKLCYEKVLTSVEGENDRHTYYCRSACDVGSSKEPSQTSTCTPSSTKYKPKPNSASPMLSHATIASKSTSTSTSTSWKKKPTAQLDEVRYLPPLLGTYGVGAPSPESSSGPEERRLICPRALNARGHGQWHQARIWFTQQLALEVDIHGSLLVRNPAGPCSESL